MKFKSIHQVLMSADHSEFLQNLSSNLGYEIGMWLQRRNIPVNMLFNKLSTNSQLSMIIYF